MSGYAPFDGLTATAVAIAIVLSAIVSLTGSAARRRNIMLGEARVQDLCELTGIMNPKALQDVFGPPDMGRVWRHVTVPQVLAARRPLGHVISGRLVDWVCIAIAALSFLFDHALVEFALLVALAVQVIGWIAATRLPR